MLGRTLKGTFKIPVARTSNCTCTKVLLEHCIPVHKALRLRELLALCHSQRKESVEELPVVQSLNVVGNQVSLNLCAHQMQCVRAIRTNM